MLSLCLMVFILFPRQFLNPKKMVMEISTTVFESKENGHENFHDSQFESKDRQNGHGNFHDSF